MLPMQERVHKELVDMFKVFPEWNFSEENIPANREIFNNMFSGIQLLDDNIHIFEEMVLSECGTHSIRLKIYEPKVKDETLPGIYFIHGGGHIIGTPEINDALCCEIVTKIPSVIISVDYRLAPETPYPGPVEDCYEGLVWFAKNSEKLGVAKDRIAVLGQSSGGGLAAAVSLLARDRKGPKIAFQMPLYPMIDDRHQTQSSKEITDRRVWNTTENKLAWDMYLSETDRENVPIYAAPSRAKDYTNLPPTYTFIGDLDPFRDETIEYIYNLTKAGVPTEFHLYPGCFHAFEEVVPNAEVSKKAKENYFNALKFALSK
jgi:acetyl esterase/lipase